MLYSLRARLVAAFILILIVPFVIIVLFFSIAAKSEIRQSIEKSTSQTMDQYSSFINTLSTQMEDLANQVLSSNVSQLWITAQMSTNQSTENLVLLDDQMRSYLSSIVLYQSTVASITVFSPKGKAVSIRDQIFLDPSFLQSSWYHAFINQGQRWVSAHLDSYQPTYLQTSLINSFVFPMAELRTLTRFGVLKVNIPTSSIQEPLDKIHFGETGRVYLLDWQGKPVLQQNISSELSGILERGIPQIKSMHESGGIISLKDERGTHLIFYRNLKVNNWVLIGEVPESELFRSVTHMLYSMLGLSVLLVLVALFAAFWLSSGIAKPLSGLAKAMRFVERGEFNAAEKMVAPPGKPKSSEVGFVIKVFGDMVRRLKHLIDTEYRANLKRRDAEYKALLMQINPHFLYNTLEVIGGLAAQKRYDEVIEATESLGRMLRFSLKLDQEQVKISEEIKYVRFFIVILQLRFGERIRIRIYEQPETSNLFVIKFILQPLVENAVKYTLEHRETAEVSISTRIAGGFLEIEVKDNGIGMQHDLVEQLQQGMFLNEETDALNTPGKKIGLRNVLDRCRLYYGDRFQFSIQTALGAGTVITIRIPANGE